MNLDALTIGQLKEISSLLNNKQELFPYKIGDNIFIRTVTMYYTGKIINLIGKWIILEECAWISDTGRFHDFIKDGKCNEYEGFIDQVSIPLDSIIDITVWKHNLFRGQK